MGSVEGGGTSHLESPGLVVGAVGARDELAEAALAREPALDVVLLRCGEVEGARDNVDDLVREADGLEVVLCVLDHLLHHLPGDCALGGGDAKLLNLLELVHAEDASSVAAMRANLLAEALADAHVAQGEILCCGRARGWVGEVGGVT